MGVDGHAQQRFRAAEVPGGFSAGVTAPFLSAQMAGTFQNLSGGRLLLNVVTGGEDAEQAMFGDFSTKEERYARADEFLEIVRRLWTGETLTFEGKYLSVENATLHQIPDPLPEIYFGGSSAAGIAVAAKHADVYLTWGEPPEAVAEKIARVRRAAAEQGRELTYGIRLHTIARATSEEAWAEADRLLENISAEDIARIQAGLKRSASEGQQRMLALNKVPRTAWRSIRICGPVSAWCAVGRVRRWSVPTPRSPTSSRPTATWVSTSSCCRGIRTSRRRTGSARACCRS